MSSNVSKFVSLENTNEVEAWPGYFQKGVCLNTKWKKQSMQRKMVKAGGRTFDIICTENYVGIIFR